MKFQTFDGVHVPAGPYDLITISHSLHHAGAPLSLLRSARQKLAPDGSSLLWRTAGLLGSKTISIRLAGDFMVSVCSNAYLRPLRKVDRLRHRNHRT